MKPVRLILALIATLAVLVCLIAAASGKGLFAPKTGGPIGPDGKTQVAVDFPVELRVENAVGRDNSGLCVFTSVMHAARWQNERRLWDFQEKMKREQGGGYPDKLTKMIAKYGPGTKLIQYEGADPAILKTALATGRMPGVTYDGHDPHYSGRIAHMLNLVCFDETADLACVLDNNFIGANDLVWMSCKDFLRRWQGQDGGWAVVLVSPPPPPPPHH